MFATDSRTATVNAGTIKISENRHFFCKTPFDNKAELMRTAYNDVSVRVCACVCLCVCVNWIG